MEIVSAHTKIKKLPSITSANKRIMKVLYGNKPEDIKYEEKEVSSFKHANKCSMLS